MGLLSKMTKQGHFEIDIPFYRTDILHQCDIAEDLVIAHGINSVPFIQPEIICIGS